VNTISEAELLAGDYEQAWQVRRSRFDQIIFDAAVAAGVEAETSCGVAQVHFDQEDRAVGVRLDDGREIEASFVVDASGQRCLLGRKLGLVEAAEDLKSIAVYSYFRGAGGLAAPLNRHAQLVASVPEGWLWFIPISPDITSIGLVTRERQKYTEEGFLELLRRSPVPIDDGDYCEVDGVQGLQTVRDWSYACRRIYGSGHVLVGDAACFVDPILAGGVDFAIRGSANAAVAVLETLGGSVDALPAYSELLKKEYQAYLRMARYWYGNNRNTEGYFWEAHQLVRGRGVSTPIRAFVYLTSGHYQADGHFKVFQEWQEKKMFRALGVDKKGLKSALESRRSGLSDSGES
jgi:flavin-dependent dehydrogenase